VLDYRRGALRKPSERETLFIDVLEKHLERMREKGFGPGTYPYEEKFFYLEQMKIWRGIMQVKEEIESKKETHRILKKKIVVSGLVLEAQKHFAESSDPFLVDYEGRHKEMFYNESNLFKWVYFFKHDLNLKDICVHIENLYNGYSFSMSGVKK
jgi:hypothetical protein